MNVAFIGLGRMGTVQARIARYFGDTVAWGIDYSENARALFQQSFNTPVFEKLSEADFSNVELVWLTVNDGNIESAAAELAQYVAPGTVVFHTSGVMDYTVIKKSLPDIFCASYHPLLPCPLPGVADADCVSAYNGVVHAIDGDVEALSLADSLIMRIHGKMVHLKSGQKARYHAAAVFASNYPLVLLDIASQLFEACGFEHCDAIEVVQKLCSQCLDSSRHVSFADALTGPVKRNDTCTIEKHERILADNDMVLNVYECLKQAAFAMLNRSL